MQVTNDGATILRSLAVDNPAAKVLIGITFLSSPQFPNLHPPCLRMRFVDLSKVQDEEVGDGTTSVCVLASELLREAEKLIEQKVHPQIIISGFREAARAARQALEETSIDLSKDENALKAAMLNIARTTLSSKILSQDKEYFAQMAVDAVLHLRRSTDLDRIQIIKKIGGSLTDSFFDDGLILDKKIGLNQPKRLQNAKIMIANTAMDTDKVKVFGSRFKVDSPEQLAELERAEREKMREKVDKIRKHGVNCFVNRQLIYNWPEQLFADAGIMTVEHADFDGIERLALVTGGQIASTFDNPELAVLGECAVVEEIMIGEDRLVKFTGPKEGAACTVILRGATQQLLDEAERSLHDAFCVLTQFVKEPKTVLGGGCSEMLMANAVEARIPHVQGKQMLAVESFARALRQLPTILADNGGYDSSELVAQLRSMHAQGFRNAGLDMYNGGVADMTQLGVQEALKLKRQVLTSASEAAEMILRVDDIIKAAPRKRNH